MEGWPRVATDHEGEVAGVEGSGDADRRNDRGNVQGEDPGCPEEAGGQAEKGTGKGCSPSKELLGMAVVEMDRDKAQERSR